MFRDVGKILVGIMACVLLPVAAVGLMVGGRYAFSNVPSMLGTALLVALGLGCFMRKRLPENQRLSRRTGVGLAFCSVLFLTAGVTKTLREDAAIDTAKTEAKVAQEQKLVANYEAKAQLFLAETQLVRNRAIQYRGSSRLSEVGSQECGSAIRKADDISPNRHEASFRAWYYAWYMCATYAGDINSVPSLSDYEKTRPNLKDLLG